MPYRLTWEPQGVYREYLGDVSIGERLRSFEAICGSPHFDGLRYTITDYLAVRHYEISASATAEIAAMHIGPLATNERIVIAAVAVRPDILAAIVDFKAQGFVDCPYEAFATLAEARQWIARLTGA